MTGYGFGGPWTAQGTVFDAKAEGAATQVRRGPSARGRSRARGRKAVLWWLLILLPGWI